MKSTRLIGALLLGIFLGHAAGATETIGYQYDALGRLITTTRSGGTQTVYTLDAAGNRAQAQSSGSTTPSTPPSITVPTSSSTGNYTISWGASTSGVVSAYELYESTSAAFTPQSLVFSGTGTSLPISSKPNGTYYYRVRACNTTCSAYLAGANPITVQVSSGPAITLDDLSVSGQQSLGSISFTYGLASSGSITIGGTGASVSGPAHLTWVTPPSGMNLYQGRATSACPFKTGTYTTWQALGTGSTPTWGVSLTPNKSAQCTILIEISAIANPSVILDNATITLDLSTQP